MMLEGACVGYARAVQADLIVEKEGPVCHHMTSDPQTGAPLEKLKAHPAIGISRGAWGQVRAFASEFGLSPVSRTRLAIEKQDDGEADLMALLSQPRVKKPSVVQ
jgi:P27 family predicted phage terminase small subunit